MLHRHYLHTFLTVYRTGSQSKAALELHLTQPAVSQHIKILESRLGRSLFSRIGKKIIPTPAAHQLALQLGPPLDALDALWESFYPEANPIVYLGGIAEFFAKIIVPELPKLIEKNITLRFEIGHQNLVAKLLENELDIAHFTSHHVHPGIVIESFFDEDLVLVGHPMWRTKTKTLHQLPWIAYDESLLFIKEYYQVIFQTSFVGKIHLMIKDLWSIERAAIAGVGITVLPRYFCQESLSKKKLILLHSPPKPFVHRFYLGYRDGALRNPNVSLVRNLMKIAAAKQSYR